MDKFDEKARIALGVPLTAKINREAQKQVEGVAQALHDVAREEQERCVKLVRDHADAYIMDEVEVLVAQIRAAKEADVTPS